MKILKKVTLALILISLCSSVATAELIAEQSGEISSSAIFDGEVATPAPETNYTPSIPSAPSGATQVSGNNSEQPLAPEAPGDSASSPVQPTIKGFTDVSESDWFYSDVIYASDNKIMSGVGDGIFSPNTGITRAMMITIIYRTAKEPEAGVSSFSDVEDGSWYSKAVAWGAENKIVNGTGNNMFSPDDYITREQLAVMLYNYSKLTEKSGNTTDISAFADTAAVSSWAKEAMCWAVGNKIVNGKGDGILAPTDGATRAEAAAIIRRFINL